MSEQHTPSENLRQPSPPHSGFTCTRSIGLGALTLEARGRIDTDAAAQLRQTLRDALDDARLVVLDLQAVDFIDAAGVYAIVRANSAAHRDGRRLVIVHPPADVDAALKLDSGEGGLAVVDTSAAARREPHSVGGPDLDVPPESRTRRSIGDRPIPRSS